MLGCLGSLSSDIAIEPDGGLADYGLEYPVLTVSYTAGTLSGSLSVGDAYPYGADRYISIEGDNRVFVVDSLIYTDFQLTRSDLFTKITLKTEEADTDTGMSYSYIVDYRTENFEEYGLGDGAEKLVVSYEVTEEKEVPAVDEETGEEYTEVVSEAVQKEAVFYVGDMTEDEAYYYVNQENSEYTPAVSEATIESLRNNGNGTEEE